MGSSLRNAAYGLRQSLDTVGAVLGPLAAIGLLAVYADNLRLVLWFGVIPAVIAVAILAEIVLVRRGGTALPKSAEGPMARAR